MFINRSFSQTVIDYSAWSSGQCNAFYPSASVNSITHTTTCGTVIYDNVNHAIELDTRAENNIYKGTEYKLGFNFKQGYSYTIKINAWCNTPTFPVPNSKMRVDFNGASNGSGAFCNSVESFNTTSSLTNNNNLQLNPGVFSDYSFQYNSLPVAQGYLYIGGFLQYINGTATSWILIKKITITESAPAASFSISSSISSLTCGATTPVTFTVNNGAGTTGITGYTWNLGATPNGWLLPDGSAAPQTYSTGTTNTLTLTPNCGKALSAVSSTVTANGINYNTNNSSSVSISQPSFSISGNSSLCSGNTSYTINGLPCNSTIAWTAPPSNLGSLSSLTTSPTTLTYGGTSGNFTLTANVTSCGATTPVTFPVHVGAYTSSDYTLSGNNGSMYWCPNQNITFTVSGTGSSNYNWTLPTGWTMNYNGGSYVSIKAPSSSNPSTGTLTVSFTEPCGTVITLNKFLAYSSSACTSSPYTVSPNPASSTITIACASLQTYCNIAAVQITDLYGTVKSSQSWPYTNQQVQMSVSFLTNGTYIAKIYDGTQWYSNQFIVQH